MAVKLRFPLLLARCVLETRELVGELGGVLEESIAELLDKRGELP